MKGSDVILQIQSKLPGLTNMFSTDYPLTSLTKAGTTVTAVTTTPHGLSVGHYAYMANTNRQTDILSVTRVGTVATIVTQDPHDLTENFFETVDMVGFTAGGTVFNGNFPLLSVPNRYTYTIRVANSGATTGTGPGKLLEPWRLGFRGWVQVVTVPTSTSFTYTSADSFNATAYGTNMVARTVPRITGAASLERAQASYTKFGNNQLWAFIIMGDVVASKSRHTMTDPIGTSTAASTYRQFLMNSVYVYVFIPMTQSISGRAERDLMADVGKYLYKSMVGKAYPSYFVDEPVATLNFKQHHQAQYLTSYYIHEFEFEAVTEITTNDIVEPDTTRAFRDLYLHQLNDFNVENLSTQINLDDIPI